MLIALCGILYLLFINPLYMQLVFMFDYIRYFLAIIVSEIIRIIDFILCVKILTMV